MHDDGLPNSLHENHNVFNRDSLYGEELEYDLS